MKSLKDAIANRETKKDAAISAKGSDQTTFVIEALLLMLCLMMIIAVSTMVIVHSVKMTQYYSHKTEAITLAANTAERFAADPETVAREYKVDDLVATCDTHSFSNATGTVYDATISVEWNGDKLYILNTTKYVEGQKGGDE